MFCPRCAAQNQDQTKFCRSCGTDLKTVALALQGQLTPPPEASNAAERKLELSQEWLKREADGMRNAVQGALLLGTAVLIGVALGLFSREPDWIIIWMIFVGWLAVWGVLGLGAGLSSLMQSRMMLRRIDGLIDAKLASAAPAAGATQRIAEAAATLDEAPPSSVTEHTTMPLNKPQPRL